jgi:hypothetical protein
MARPGASRSRFSRGSIGTIISGTARGATNLANSVADSISEMGRSVVDIGSAHRVRTTGSKNASPQIILGGIGVFVALVLMLLTFIVPDGKMNRKNRVATHCLAQTIVILSAALVIKGGNKSGVNNSIAALVLFMIIPLAISVGFFYYIDKKEKVNDEEMRMLSITPLLSLLFAVYLLYFVDGDE